jgi:hypothetical protein
VAAGDEADEGLGDLAQAGHAEFRGAYLDPGERDLCGLSVAAVGIVASNAANDLRRCEAEVAVPSFGAQESGIVARKLQALVNQRIADHAPESGPEGFSAADMAATA